MSDLLAIGSSAIGSLRAALATVGENVANAETPGYVRRTARIAELAPSGTAGGIRMSGARLAAIERHWEQHLAAEVHRLGGDAQLAQAKAETATAIELALADNQDGVGKRMTALFAQGERWAAEPASAAHRHAWLDQLDATAAAFNRTGDALQRLQLAGEEQRAATAQEANSLLGELAAVNRSLRTVARGSAAAAELLDRRDRAVGTLSGLIDLRVSYSDRGEAHVSSGAIALLDGIDAATLAWNEAPPTGLRLVASSPAGTATLEPQSGRLAGQLAGRQSLDQRMAELDALARDFATALNQWSQSGIAPDGTPGSALLVGDSAVSLTLAATGADRLAAGSPAAANGNLLALGTLRQTGQFEQRWDNLVSASASAKARSDRTASASGALLDAATIAHAARSGVDFDREAADLLRLQQAYGAAARILDVAKSTIDSLLAIR